MQPVRLPNQKIGERTVTLSMICSYEIEGEGATPDYPEFWAIRFKVVTPAPKQIKVTAECSHDPVMHYFNKLLKEIGWPFPNSPKAQEFVSTGWPETIEAKRTDLEQIIKPLPFDRWEIHSHLRALCDYDAQFLIHKPVKDTVLEELMVLDAQAIRRACTVREATIGTMQLLPEKSGIAIKFVAQDAPFHEEIPNRGKALFREFIRRVKKHFDELTRQQVQTEPLMLTRDGMPESTPISNEESPTTDIDRLLSDRSTMLQYIKHYNPDTAKEIAKAIPRAWALHTYEGGRWGPGYIAKVCYAVTSATIGRYLRAFKEAGLTEIDGINIPHHYRKEPRQ